MKITAKPFVLVLLSTAACCIAVTSLVAFTPMRSLAATVIARVAVAVETPFTISINSNLLFGPIAPVAVTPPPASSSNSNNNAENRELPGSDALSELLGTAASVSIVGEPNQTYSILLPTGTSISDGTSVFEVTGYEHSAGMTPVIDSSGAGGFSIGANIQEPNAPDAPSGDSPDESSDVADADDSVSAQIDGDSGDVTASGENTEDNSAIFNDEVFGGAVNIGTAYFPITLSYN